MNMKPTLEEQSLPRQQAGLPAGKVEPLCPVFGECQGCFYQNISYPDELKAKEQWLLDLLGASLDIPDGRFS